MKDRKTRKPARLADVAKLAGVSITAVSAVLNNGCGKTAKVGEKAAEKVRKAAEELGYQANIAARSLVTGKTGFIGFMLSSSVSHGFKNPYFSNYLQGAESACRARGYGLAVAWAALGEAGSFIKSNLLMQRRIDGLLVAGEMDSESYTELESSGVPFIILNALPKEKRPTIGTPGQVAIFKYFERSGHKRAIMTLDAGVNPCDRAEVERMAKSLCPSVELELLSPAKEFQPNWEPGVGLGRHLFERWVAKPPERRATIVESNGVLLELYGELLAEGFKCPEDLSLLADNSLDFWTFPRFTRIRGPLERTASDAAALLIEAIEDGRPVDLLACRAKIYESEFIQGETVREVKA